MSGYWDHDDYKQAMNDAIFDKAEYEVPTEKMESLGPTISPDYFWDNSENKWVYLPVTSEAAKLDKDAENLTLDESWDTIWAAALKLSHQSNTRSFKCLGCDKKYSHSDAVKKHYKKKHPDGGLINRKVWSYCTRLF